MAVIGYRLFACLLGLTILAQTSLAAPAGGELPELPFPVAAPLTDLELCEVFVIYPDLTFPGSTMQSANINSESLCKNTCIRMQICVAVDFNLLTKRCSMITNAANLQVAGTPTAQTNHMRVVDRNCANCAIYSTVPNTLSNNGVSRGTGLTVARCKEICRTVPTCVAVDYNNRNGQCWTHTSVAVTQGSSDVSQHRINLQACFQTGVKTTKKPDVPVVPAVTTQAPAPPDGCTWKSFSGKQSGGGSLKNTAKTAAACQAECRKTTGCVAVDFNNDLKRCFLHLNANNIKVQASNTAVTQYQLICAGVCEAYSKVASTSSSNGKPATATTLAACQTECTASAACAGLDYNSAQKKCWLHLNAISMKETAKINTKVDQYRIDRTKCGGVTAGPNVSPGVSPGVTSAKPTACDKWVKTAKKNSDSGIPKTAATVDACKAECDKVTGCVAVDFNSVDKKCWIHTSSKAAKDNTKTDQYKIDPAKCTTTTCDKWVKTAKKSSDSGTQKTATTVDACKAECDKVTGCVAVDFNSADKKCWIHTSSKASKDNAKTDQYKIDANKCKTGTCDAFTVMAKTESAESILVASTTLETCKAECLLTTGCVGLDYSATSKKCWVHKSSINMIYGATTSTDKDQYRLDSTKCEPDCDKFTKKAKTESAQSILTSATTLSACKAECEKTTGCVGLDYSTSNRCYLHTSATKMIYGEASSTDKDQYRLDAAKCEEGCDRYIKWASKLSPGSTQQAATLNSLSLCKGQCDKTTACVGLDYNPNTKRCWLHTDAKKMTDGAINSNGIVDQYRVDKTKCVTECDKFVKHEKLGTLGGTEIPSTSLSGCKADCLKTSGCVGLDYNPNTKKCWIHKDSTFMITNAKSNDLTHQYRVDANKCKSTTCDKFTQVSNTKSPGGIEVTSKTPEACKAECEKTTGCVGLDFNPTLSKCWIHKDATNMVSKKETSSVTNQYRLDTTKCDEECDKFVKLANKEADSVLKTVVTSAKTLAACKAECDKTTSCVGLEYSKTNVCSIHKSAIDLQFGEKDSTTKDLYKLDRNKCVKGCDKFDKFDKTGTLGGDQVTTVSTLAACKTHCEATTGCVGLDYNPALGKCWIHKNAATMISGAKTSSFSDQYRINPSKCDTTGCDKYTKLANQASLSGQLVAATTLATCKAECDQTTGCVGLDYSASLTQCYLHKNALFMELGRGPSTTKDQYTLDRTKCLLDCDRYIETANKESSGGINVAAATTLVECKAYCDKTTGCVGLDFGAAAKDCQIYTNALTMVLSSKTSATKKQYTIDPTKCIKDCDRYNVVAGKASGGGQLKTTATTLAACKAECDKTTTCVGLDFSTTNKCYLHSNLNTMVANAVSTTLASQYRVDATKCKTECDKYVKVAGKGTLGGELVSSNSVASCKAKCDATTGCVGFDFNPTTNRCWTHKDSAKMISGAATSPTDQYRADATKCPSACDRYTKYIGQTSPNGIEVVGATVAECKAQCDKATSCIALDFNPDTKKCWLHTNADNLKTLDKKNPKAEQYQVDATKCQTVCDKYTEVAGKYADGGIEVIGITVVACKAQCDKTPICKGVDFNKNDKKCWIHIDETKMKVTKANVAFTQYRLDATKCAKDTCEKFTLVPNIHSAESTSTTITDLEKCKEHCLGDQKCVGIDFIAGVSKCWIHTSKTSMETKSVPDTSSQQYRLVQRTCACDRYTKKANWQSTGGNLRPATTETSCKMECDKTTGCVGLDFDRVAKTCTIYTTAASITTGLTNNNKDQYKVDAAKCVTACDRYTKKANWYSSIQPPLRPATTEATCKAECDKTTGCVGLDFDRVGKKCYIHTDALAMDRSGQTNLIYDQYKVDVTKCTTACDRYDKLAGKGASGGEPKGAMTLEACKTLCDGTTTCVGIDYNPTSKACWLHKNRALMLAITNSVTTDQYRINPTKCPCDKYIKFPQTYSAGGVIAATTVNTLVLCKAECDKATSCVGVEWNPDTSKCWTHNNKAQMENSQTIPTGSTLIVNQYRKDENKCKTSKLTCDRYVEFAKLSSAGGIKSAPKTLEDCKILCDATTSCIGLEFKASTGECFLHKNQIPTAAVKADTNQYKVDPTKCIKGCKFATGKAQTSANGYRQPGAVNTLALCKTACQSLTNCLGIDYDDTSKLCYTHTNAASFGGQRTASSTAKQYAYLCCAFGNGKGQTSTGGIQQATATDTLVKCKQACYVLTGCVAIEFKAGTKTCTIHTNAANIKTFTASGEILQYPYTCKEECQQFKEITGQFSSGASLSTTANTVETCKAQCLADTTCVGVDVRTNINPNQCWSHNDKTKFDAKIRDASYIQYELITRTCTVPSVCDKYDKLTGKVSETAVGRKAVASTVLDSCKKECDLTTGCVGLDFYRIVPKCVLQTNKPSMLLTIASNALVDQYQLNPAKCGTTPAVCDKFVAYPGTSLITLPAVSTTSKTLAACKAECLATTTAPACIAIEFRTATNQCYLHRTTYTNIINNSKKKADVPTIDTDQYRIDDQKCKTTCTWDAGKAFTSTGGTPKAGGTTLDKCKAECSAVFGCPGIDFKSGTTPVCWIHTAATFITKKAAIAGTSQYTCSRASCKNYADPILNTAARTKGTLSTASKTLALCQQECLAKITCVGFDFSTGAGTECLIHTNDATMKDAVTNSGYNQWRVLDRTCGSTPTPACVWSPQAGVGVAVGTLVSTSITQVACQTACSNMKTPTKCIAYTFTTGTNVCVLHTDAAKLAVTYKSSTSTLYTEKCTNTPTPLRSECVYITFPGKYSANGNLDSAKTLPACQDKCRATTSCAGVDFNSKTFTCVLHLNEADFLTKFSDGEENQYILTCDPCQEFTEYKLQGSNNGVPLATAKTLETCKAACIQQAKLGKCFGVDFNSGGGGSCWLHQNLKNMIVGVKEGNPPLAQYRLESPKCPAGCKFETGKTQTSPGGTPMLSSNSLEKCKTSCRITPNCVGIDFNTKLNQCWVHTNAATFGKAPGTVTNLDANQVAYTCKKCNTFGKIDKFAGKGGTIAATGTTLKACQDLCIADSTCVGVTFEAAATDKTKACTIHKDIKNIQGPTAAATKALYIIYRLLGCNSACQDGFSVVLGKGSTAATGVTKSEKSTTLTACMNECLNLGAGCKSIQWQAKQTVPNTAAGQNNDVQMQCYLSTAVLPTTLTAKTGLDSYNVLRTCAPCVDTFEVLAKKKKVPTATLR